MVLPSSAAICIDSIWPFTEGSQDTGGYFRRQPGSISFLVGFEENDAAARRRSMGRAFREWEACDRVLRRTAHWRRRRIAHIHCSRGCELGGAPRLPQVEWDLARLHGHCMDAVGVHAARPR